MPFARRLSAALLPFALLAGGLAAPSPVSGAGATGGPAAPASAPARNASPIPWDGVPGYSYLAEPTDQLGVPGSQAGAGLTPEGAVFTPSVEVTPWLAGQHVGIRGRRGLPDPKVPLMATATDRKGASAAWWATTLAGVPSAVIALEPGKRREAGVALRWGGTTEPGAQPSAYRFARPAVPERSGLYSHPGEAFVPNRCWSVKVIDGGYEIRRGDSVVAIVVGRARRSTARLAGIVPKKCASKPKTVAVALRLSLATSRSRVHVVVPFMPLPARDPRVAAIAATDIHVTGSDLAVAWRGQRSTGATVELPEPAVQRAFDASVANILIPRYQLPDGHWVQAVNQMQYHAYWLRDAAMMSNALDLVGLHSVAAEDLGFVATWQLPSGEFSSRPGQKDGLGQALWSLGQHVRLTGDKAFALAWVPSVDRAVTWTADTIAANPQGLLPPSDPRDNELIAGELTGDQLWGVAGLDAAVSLATVAGNKPLAAKARATRDKLKNRVIELARSTAMNNRIRPALDQPGGYSWGELWAAWPYPTLQPTDPLVTGTMAASIAEQKEGVATYAGGQFLHMYTGFRVWQTTLRAGDQNGPLQGLYSTLAHLTPTAGTFETNLRPYWKRDARSNIAPHGAFAAEYVTFVHDLLARDQDGALVVLGALPSAWLEPEKVTNVVNLPTNAGLVSLNFRATPNGAILTWSLKQRDPDADAPKVRFPLPPSVATATVNGEATLSGRDVVLKGTGGTVGLTWTRTPDPGPTLSGTIGLLQGEYRALKLKPPR